MSDAPPSMLRAARRIVDALQKETALARMGALADLAKAAADKEDAMRGFAAACAARDPGQQPTDPEREQLRRVLDAADENALILEAVTSTLGDLSERVRIAASTTFDPGTYNPAGKDARHVSAACVDASV